MCNGLHVKYPILMKPEFYEQIFERSRSIKFRENSSSGSRVVPCGRADRHDEVIAAFRNVGEAPKILVQLFHLMRLFPPWCNSPQWARASSFTKFLDHTQRRITVGRTPLDK